MRTDQPPTRGRVVTDVLGYAAARLVLAVALTAAIYGVTRLVGAYDFPVSVAVLLALVVAMPLGMWVFSPLRHRATAGMAILGERRRRDRARLQARLRGEPVADAGPEPGPEPGPTD